MTKLTQKLDQLEIENYKLSKAKGDAEYEKSKIVEFSLSRKQR